MEQEKKMDGVEPCEGAGEGQSRSDGQYLNKPGEKEKVERLRASAQGKSHRALINERFRELPALAYVKCKATTQEFAVFEQDTLDEIKRALTTEVSSVPYVVIVRPSVVGSAQAGSDYAFVITEVNPTIQAMTELLEVDLVLSIVQVLSIRVIEVPAPVEKPKPILGDIDEEEAKLQAKVDEVKAKVADAERKREEDILLCAASGHVWGHYSIREAACDRCGAPGVVMTRADVLELARWRMTGKP